MLGRYNTFVCRECLKKRPGNYFISPSLCKKCAAKRRTKPDNSLVQPIEGILLTQLALKRLKKVSEREIPKTLRDFLAGPSFLFVCILSWYTGFKYGIKLNILKGSGSAFFLWWMLFSVGIPTSLGIGLMTWLQHPRAQKVKVRLAALLRERQNGIEEAERFYGSPEWKALRQKTITEKGTSCAVCFRTIRRESDLTVDHIKPRSRFPNLALDASNLQVMCRRCNSRKGDRLF